MQHDRTASLEAKAWSEKLSQRLLLGHASSIISSPHDNDTNADTLSSEGDNFGEEGSHKRKIVYKLQVLYGTNLQGADIKVFSSAPRTSDPYVVAKCHGKELARSAVTPQSIYPLFRRLQHSGSGSDVFCVDIPNEVAFANVNRANAAELILQVYDHDSMGSDNFLGEARLRALELRSAVGRRIVKQLNPIKDRTDQGYVGGEVHVAGHLVPAKPHLMVHIVEAHDLHIPAHSAGKALHTSKTQRQRRGMRLPRVVNSTKIPVVSPFVICYWDGKEIGRTDVRRQTRYPRWDDDAENAFRVDFSINEEIAKDRIWRRQYCPTLRFEVYNTAICPVHKT